MPTKPIVLEEKPISGIGKTVRRTSLTQKGEIVTEKEQDFGAVTLKVGNSTSKWGSMKITTRE